MSDGPFKSMAREGNGLPRSLRHIPALIEISDPVRWHSRRTTKCERCGARLRAGDWPWCKGKPEDHDR